MGSSGTFVAGVLICLIGDVILNFGVNVQKLSHLHERKLPPHERKPYVKQWRWWIGMVIFLLGNAGELIAIGLISPTITTPLGSVALISNVFFAHFLFQERLDRYTFFATALIISGAVLVTVFGVGDRSVEYSSQDIEALISETPFIAYFTVVLLLIAANLAYFLYHFRLLQGTHDKDVLHFERVSPLKRTLIQLSELTFAGLVGSQTVLFVKASSEVVKYSFAHPENNAFLRPLPYFLVLIAITSAITQVHALNVGLKHFKALYVVPVFYISWTLSSIIGAGCFFHDFADFTAANYVLFTFGIMAIFSGVVFLSLSSSAHVVGNAHGFDTNADTEDEVDLETNRRNQQHELDAEPMLYRKDSDE